MQAEVATRWGWKPRRGSPRWLLPFPFSDFSVRRLWDYPLAPEAGGGGNREKQAVIRLIDCPPISFRAVSYWELCSLVLKNKHSSFLPHWFCGKPGTEWRHGSLEPIFQIATRNPGNKIQKWAYLPPTWRICGKIGLHHWRSETSGNYPVERVKRAQNLLFSLYSG